METHHKIPEKEPKGQGSTASESVERKLGEKYLGGTVGLTLEWERRLPWETVPEAKKR